MRTVDIGAIFLIYDLVIGVLLMLASEKLGSYAGSINRAYTERIARLTRVSVFALGCVIAVLSGSIYLVFHVLKMDI